MKAIKTIFLVLLLTACGNKENIAEQDDPELVAVAFFEAIYNEKDIKKAANACTPKISRILLHYNSANAIARHLFNMSYDNVEVTPESSGVKVREQFRHSATVTLYFDGYYNDRKMKDVKRLRLKQLDGKWLISEFLKDPF